MNLELKVSKVWFPLIVAAKMSFSKEMSNNLNVMFPYTIQYEPKRVE